MAAAARSRRWLEIFAHCSPWVWPQLVFATAAKGRSCLKRTFVGSHLSLFKKKAPICEIFTSSPRPLKKRVNTVEPQFITWSFRSWTVLASMKKARSDWLAYTPQTFLQNSLCGGVILYAIFIFNYTPVKTRYTLLFSGACTHWFRFHSYQWETWLWFPNIAATKECCYS